MDAKKSLDSPMSETPSVSSRPNSERLLVRVADGVTFYVDATYERFIDIWSRTLKRNEWIEVWNDEGKRRMVNPHQIIYVAQPDKVRESKGEM